VRFPRFACALVVLAACSAPPEPEALAPSPPTPSASPARAPTVAEAPAPTPPRALTPALHFSHDDLDAALERARKSGKVVLVDAWAPWCHTCLSMQAYVLSDPSLAPFAEHVEAVAIDTDREANAAFLERYAMQAWPTFFVLDPKDGEVFGYWAGSATVEEMRGFLDEGRKAVAAARAGTQPGPEGELVRGHAAFARKDAKGAVKGYSAAAKALAPSDPRRSEALLGWLRALYMQKSWGPCAAMAREHIEGVRGGATPADFSYYTLTCAGELPRGKQRDATTAAGGVQAGGARGEPEPWRDGGRSRRRALHPRRRAARRG
jgi:thiol-disulfide isomerase/thioredoxin